MKMLTCIWSLYFAFVNCKVSAYVANLAAFLTRSNYEYVGTMEGVAENRLEVCAYPSLKAELKISHPNANFVFSQTATDYVGILEDYDLDKCKAMAISHIMMSPNAELMAELCARDLVFTDALVIENGSPSPVDLWINLEHSSINTLICSSSCGYLKQPVTFPVRPGLGMCLCLKVSLATSMLYYKISTCNFILTFISIF